MMLRRLLLLAAFALVAACAPTTELLRSSVEGQSAQPAQRLLVVGVSTDDALRRRYEQAFVQELAAAGLTGIASSDLLPSIAGLTMPEIRDRMQAFSDRADAVLHVQLMTLAQEPTWSPHDLPGDSAPPTRRIAGMNVTINQPPDGEVRGSQMRVELESNLYTLPERRLLWTVLTATREANDPVAVARSHAQLLIKAMRKRGYVAGQP